jgi:hypothetical protein
VRKTIVNKEELEAKDWNDFHSKIGTTRDDMKALEAINAKHRHGTHSSRAYKAAIGHLVNER